MANKLNEISGQPQMNMVFNGWEVPLTLRRDVQVIDDGFVSQISNSVLFKGIVQPLKPNQLMLKPEGLRAFEWLQIHCRVGSIELVPNDRVVYNGQLYKVMAVNNYNLNNYVEYHVIQDYVGT